MQQVVAKSIGAKTLPAVRECEIQNTRYVVKSTFLGKQDMKTALMLLAERKAIREMGLDGVVL
jgi:hypothetical protein